MAEPNLPKVTVKKCASEEEAIGELVKGLLANEPMSLQMLVSILESDPYNILDPTKISTALNQLNEMNLIKIKRFTATWLATSDIDVVLDLVRV